MKTLRQIVKYGIILFPIIVTPLYFILYFISTIPGLNDYGIVFGLPLYFVLVVPGFMIGSTLGLIGSSEYFEISAEGYFFIIGFWVIYEVIMVSGWFWYTRIYRSQ